MPQTEAARAVRVAVDGSGMTRAQFAEAANLDIGTLGDFLNGKRWPQGPTLRKIEAVLRWPSGRIDELAEGASASARWSEVEDAIRNDPMLLPEAKEHLLKQYALLLRVQPSPDHVGDADRIAEEADALAELRARRTTSEGKRPRKDR